MRFSAATLAGLLAVADSASAAGLNELAVKAGKLYFGTGTDNGVLSDSAYTAVVSDTNMFGQLTPGNGQKWDYVEAKQGVFTYGYADVVPNYAKKNGQILRCHTLLYRAQTPQWVTSTKWTKAQMTSVINTHINNVMGHYKGQCYSWDVVNEAIDDQGNYRQDTSFYNVLGLDYMTLAFNTARAADPATKLYYNDYNIENVNPKQQKTLELVKYLLDAGAPVQGVGLQGHFIVGSMPSQADLETAAKQFTALGLEVAYTEFDVKFTSLPYNAAGLKSQGDAYAAVIKACLNTAGCVGWTIWDWTDKYSWVPGTFPGQGGACLWDENLKPKPAYYSVSSALAAAGGAATAVPSSSSALPATTTAVVSTSAAAAAGTTTTTKAAASSAAAASGTKASSVVVSSQASNGTAVQPTATTVPSGGVVPTPFLPPNATALFPNATMSLTRPAGGAATSVPAGLSPAASSGVVPDVPGAAASSAPTGLPPAVSSGVAPDVPVGPVTVTVTVPANGASSSAPGTDIGGPVTVTVTVPANGAPAGPTQPAGAIPTSPLANDGGDDTSPTPAVGGGGDAALTAAPPSYTTTTIYTTNIYTITACAADVPDCPGSIGKATVEIITITTTVPCETTTVAAAAVTTPTTAAAAGVFVPGVPFSNGTIPSGAGLKPTTLSSVTLGTGAPPAATEGSVECKKKRRAKRHAVMAPHQA